MLWSKFPSSITPESVMISIAEFWHLSCQDSIRATGSRAGTAAVMAV